jgi:peptidoglycan/LPS O-acetylase OafA/YrhL
MIGTTRENGPPIDKRRLEFLDALRGLAAVYVVVYHMLLLPQPHLSAPRWAEKFAMAGGMGVTLFFIVSAFSLYYTMPLRLKEKNPTLSFYLHRFFRIAPLFYFLMVMTLIRDRVLFNATHSAFDIATSATFVFNLIPTKQEGFVWAGWTIGVEMVFYAVFPLIYSRIRTISNAVAFAFVCLLFWMLLQLALQYMVIPPEWSASILQWSTFKHFPVFAMGIVVYQIFMALDSGKLHAGFYAGIGNAFLWGGIFGFMALLQGWLPNIFGDGYYWQGIVFGCLFLGLALSPWRLVVNTITGYLGKISYSIYLNHTTAVFLLAPAYYWLYAHTPSLTLAFLASLGLTLAIVLPFSALTYRFIEKPGIRLGKVVADKLRARHAMKRDIGMEVH